MPSKLTLGALHRCLLGRVDASQGLRVGIHFEERTSTGARATKEPGRRTVDADLALREGAVTAARLSAGNPGTAPVAITLDDEEGAVRYTIGGDAFGLLRTRPALFELEDFQARLDAIPVEDAVIDVETPERTGRLVLDAEVTSEAFTPLLRLFDASPPEHPELPLLSHAVALSAADSVALDYWWSLLGVDEVHGRPGYEGSIVCHALVSIATLTESLGVAAIGHDPVLPPLEDLDAVWELARRSRPG